MSTAQPREEVLKNFLAGVQRLEAAGFFAGRPRHPRV